MGLGTLILLANAALLGVPTSSRATRAGTSAAGASTGLSRSPRRYQAWKFVSVLNERHMLIAWVSLFGVALTDVYIRLVANGSITDPRIF